MDKNFDDRLIKLENILAGIEKFMNGFKHTTEHKNSDDAYNERKDEREDTKDAEITSREKITNENDFENSIECNKTDNCSSEISTDVSTDVVKIQSMKSTNESLETYTASDNNVEKQTMNNFEIFDQGDSTLVSDRDLNKKMVANRNVEDATGNILIENDVKKIDSKSVSECQDNTDKIEPSDKSPDNKDTIVVTVNYQELNKRLGSIEMLLKEISVSIQNLKPKGYYKNWEARHQVILSLCFVPKDVFTTVLWKLSRQMENIYTGESSVNRLFDSLPTFLVSKMSRFPANGVYININDYDIYNQCQRIREAAYYFGKKPNKSYSEDVFKTALAYLHNLVLCDITDSKVAGMMNDLEGFEQDYGLEWHEDY